MSLKIRKGTSDLDTALGQRYYVEFDGVKLGWVTRNDYSGGWDANALVGPDSYKAPSVIEGAPRRLDAVLEVLISVHRNLGRVAAWDAERSDHTVEVDRKRLRQELGIDY